MPLPSTAPPATSVGKCLPPVTRSAATPTAPAYSRIAFRARCGSCCRRAMTRYVVAAANASEACPEGNDWRFSGRDAAAGAAAGRGQTAKRKRRPSGAAALRQETGAWDVGEPGLRVQPPLRGGLWVFVPPPLLSRLLFSTLSSLGAP